jgi:hypothetical protein
MTDYGDVLYELTTKICNTDEYAPRDERLAVLMDITEVCESAYLASRVLEVVDDIDWIARSIYAFPEPWIDIDPPQGWEDLPDTHPSRLVWMAVAQATEPIEDDIHNLMHNSELLLYGALPIYV